MTTLTTLDWDAWRTAYPTLSYREQQEFHSLIYAQYPEQQHYDTTSVHAVLEQIKPRTIVELGGWNGQLAHQMLDQYPTIERWTNVEICREAADAGAHRHPRYMAATLDDYYWHSGPWICDLFIASHTIEHLSHHHLNQTIEATQAKALFLDAPLIDAPTNWHAFTGTHILETGWAGVNQTCKQHGYHLTWAIPHLTDPSSGGTARACLYTHQRINA